MIRREDQKGDTVTFNHTMAGTITSRNYRTKANSPSGTIADSDTFTFDNLGRMMDAPVQWSLRQYRGDHDLRQLRPGSRRKSLTICRSDVPGRPGLRCPQSPHTVDVSEWLDCQRDVHHRSQLHTVPVPWAPSLDTRTCRRWWSPEHRAPMPTERWSVPPICRQSANVGPPPPMQAAGKGDLGRAPGMRTRTKPARPSPGPCPALGSRPVHTGAMTRTGSRLGIAQRGT